MATVPRTSSHHSTCRSFRLPDDQGGQRRVAAAGTLCAVEYGPGAGNGLSGRRVYERVDQMDVTALVIAIIGAATSVTGVVTAVISIRIARRTATAGDVTAIATKTATEVAQKQLAIERDRHHGLLGLPRSQQRRRQLNRKPPWRTRSVTTAPKLDSGFRHQVRPTAGYERCRNGAAGAVNLRHRRTI